MTGSTKLGSRTVRAGIAAVAMTLVLGACGGSSHSATGTPPADHAVKTAPTGQRVLLDSVLTTAAEKTAHVSMSITSTGSALAGFGLTADGAVDLATGDSQITLHLSGAMSALLGDGIEARSVGGISYVKLPDSLGSLGGLGLTGGKWLKFDPSDLGSAGSSPFGFGGESDPTKFLAYLDTVSDGVHNVGSDTIRGVDTTHYHASLDLGKAVDKADVPPALRAQLHQLLAAQGGTAPVLPADVWVDAQGRVRRIQLALDPASFLGGAAPGATSGAASTVTVSLDLYDFGTPVNVQAPPADQITQLPSFGDLGASGSLGSLGGLGDAPSSASS